MVCHTALLKKLETRIRDWLKQVLSKPFTIQPTESSVEYLKAWCWGQFYSRLGVGANFIKWPSRVWCFFRSFNVRRRHCFSCDSWSFSNHSNNVMVNLLALSKWFLHNKLMNNTRKSKLIDSRSKHFDFDTFSLAIENKIENVVYWKLKRVIFDQHLHWAELIHSICNKLALGC